MRKQRDARIVTLEQDFIVGKTLVGGMSENPYKKGTTHAIHADQVEKLKKKGVKMRVEKPDWEKLHTEARKRRQKAAA